MCSWLSLKLWLASHIFFTLLSWPMQKICWALLHKICVLVQLEKVVNVLWSRGHSLYYSILATTTSTYHHFFRFGELLWMQTFPLGLISLGRLWTILSFFFCELLQYFAGAYIFCDGSGPFIFLFLDDCPMWLNGFVKWMESGWHYTRGTKTYIVLQLSSWVIVAVTMCGQKRFAFFIVLLAFSGEAFVKLRNGEITWRMG